MTKKQSPAIRTAKIEAKALAKTTDRTYCQLLDERAKAAGYGTWKALLLANPSTITVASEPSPWNAVIRFTKPVDRTLWISDPLIPEDDERTSGDWSIPAALAWGDGAVPIWRSDVEVAIGATSRYHALAVLGILPGQHLVGNGAAYSIEGPRVSEEVPYRTKQLDYIEQDDIELKGRQDPLIEGWDENLINSLSWSALEEIFGMISSDASYIQKPIDDMLKTMKPGQSGLMVAKAGEAAPYYMVFDGRPDPDDMRKGIGSLCTWEWRDLVEIGYTDNHDLEVFASDDGVTYMLHGLDWDFVMKVDPKNNLEDESPAHASIEAWWRNRERMGGANIFPVMMGDGHIAVGRRTRIHSSDRPIVAILGSCRPLGELPTEGFERWPVTEDRTRRLGLFGDFSQ
jgi:hypothetical protein